MTLDADKVLQSEGNRLLLDSLNEAGLDHVSVVGAVAVAAQPLHPAIGMGTRE